MSDPTRRSLLTRVCQEGPCRVTDLAALYDVSLNAISKHLKVLEKCGLITRTTSGRVHWIEANLANIQIVENWFRELKSIWELRLDTFSALIENNMENKNE
ncbi:MAG: metalloregulator ArsR/SmtB family transcription factor [Pseudomonadales bacterium]|nr:metalloregulator ArsR/SmtB family transcription factor [Pseudomonadales bacterium]